MTRPPSAMPSGATDGGAMSRHQAAQLLKLARTQGGGDVVNEAIDWAFAAMPDRAIVQRLKIRSLMRTGQFEAADALLAQALLIYPLDPVLSVLRAERLLSRGRPDSATREIELVLARHPHRTSALAVGARIASSIGDHVRASLLLERAVSLRPADASLRAQYIEALLAKGEPVQAARQLAYLYDAPATLEARVLRAQGRAVDALARLQAEWRLAKESASADELASMIIDLLEETGRLEELERFASSLEPTCPAALARAAQTWLALGRFDDALALGGQLLKRRAFVPIARGIVLVAATMKGNFGLAQRVVRQLITSTLTIDRISLAELWRRGMIGRFIVKHTALGKPSEGVEKSVLATYAQAAAELFREQLADVEMAADPAETAELLHLIRLCSLAATSAPMAVPAEAAAEPALPEASPTPSLARRAA